MARGFRMLAFLQAPPAAASLVIFQQAMAR